MLHKSITGESEIIVIHANGRRNIPLAIYEDALINAPKHLQIFNHIITLRIDGVEYTDKHLGDLVIALIFHSALDNMFAEPDIGNLVDVQFCTLASLPSYLSVMSWALIFIKPSKMLQAVKDDIRMCIKYYTRYVRSLVCGSDSSFNSAEARFRYVESAGVKTPDYLVDYISLPISGGRREAVLTKLSNEDALYHVDKREIEDNSNPYLSFCVPIYAPVITDAKNIRCSRSLFEDYEGTTTGTKVAEVNQRIINDIIFARRDLMLEREPNKFKVEGFGPECEKLLREIIGGSDVCLYSSEAPRMTIYNVMQYGLKAALEADYE